MRARNVCFYRRNEFSSVSSVHPGTSRAAVVCRVSPVFELVSSAGFSISSVRFRSNLVQFLSS